MRKFKSIALMLFSCLCCSGLQANGQAPITKTMTLTGNQVGPFNIQAMVNGPTQSVPMADMANDPNCNNMMPPVMGAPLPPDPPPPPSTPTPPVDQSPTSYVQPPGFAPFVTPPEGVQTNPDGTTVTVYPGGTAVTSRPGSPNIITPPGLGEDKTHGPVIARQRLPNGNIIEIYQDGFWSRNGTFGAKQIWGWN